MLSKKDDDILTKSDEDILREGVETFGVDKVAIFLNKQLSDLGKNDITDLFDKLRNKFNVKDIVFVSKQPTVFTDMWEVRAIMDGKVKTFKISNNLDILEITDEG